jgi:hypothetical protein
MPVSGFLSITKQSGRDPHDKTELKAHLLIPEDERAVFMPRR